MWPFKRRHEEHVDVEQSARAVAEAFSRRARTRRVSVALDRAMTQNHYTADIETIFEGKRK